jgi:hypothetical protein
LAPDKRSHDRQETQLTVLKKTKTWNAFKPFQLFQYFNFPLLVYVDLSSQRFSSGLLRLRFTSSEAFSRIYLSGNGWWSRWAESRWLTSFLPT